MPVSQERLLATLRTLLELNSPTGKETEVARYLSAELAAINGEVSLDATGNLIAHFAGSGDPLLLNAHMDTVLPTVGLRIEERDGRWQSDGTTILGGDDKAGIAVIVEALRALNDRQEPHLPLDIAFTVAEEIGLVGAKGLDYSRIRAKRGLCMDASGPAGTIIVAAPSQISLDVTITGRAAHAGVAPEKGISAIEVAATAIAAMHLGRIDEETTANVGTIQGGTARNIVPEEAFILAEARSRDDSKMRRQADSMIHEFEAAAARFGAKVGIQKTFPYQAFNLRPSDPIVRMVVKAAEGLGIKVKLGATGGGSDTNVFNQQGIRTLLLGTGSDDVHTTTEYVSIPDLVRAAELLYEIASKTS